MASSGGASFRWSDRQTLVGGGGAGCGAWGGVCLWLQFEGSVLVSGQYLWVGHDGGGVATPATGTPIKLMLIYTANSPAANSPEALAGAKAAAMAINSAGGIKGHQISRSSVAMISSAPILRPSPRRRR